MAKRGKEVSVSSNVDLSEVSVRLKQGESIKVIFFGTEDYFEYNSHNDFGNKIYPQPCLLEDELNAECPYCVANKHGIEGLKLKKRVMFAFYCTSQKKTMFWDATASQGKKMIKQINGYAEDIDFGSVFELSREGTGKETSYTLSLISERKYTKADKEAIEFVKEKGALTDDELFSALQPKSRKLAIGLLDGLGFDVCKHFADAEQILAEQADSDNASDDAQEFVPVDDDVTDDDLPF